MPSPCIVLVVEDEPLLLMVAVGLVQDAGFETIEATNADDALRILEARSDIRIVFTDIQMPGSMDGMKLAVFIRDRWPPIELVITSARKNFLEEELPSRAVFFSKPYDNDMVIETLRRLAA